MTLISRARTLSSLKSFSLSSSQESSDLESRANNLAISRYLRRTKFNSPSCIESWLSSGPLPYYIDYLASYQDRLQNIEESSYSRELVDDSTNPNPVAEDIAELAVDIAKASSEVGRHIAEESLELNAWQFKELRFPLLSEFMTLRMEIKDFYEMLRVGLDSLHRLANHDSNFFSNTFLQESVNLLTSIDFQTRRLVKKLVDLRSGVNCSPLYQVHEVVTEYQDISAIIFQIWSFLKFSMTSLKGYYNLQVEATVQAMEELAIFSKTHPLTIPISKAKAAATCINVCTQEMCEMKQQVQTLLSSGPEEELLSSFVPNLSSRMPQIESKWDGLSGVLFAMKTTTAYICQLLLAALAYVDQGPTLRMSMVLSNEDAGWTLSLVRLHIIVREKYNRIGDTISGAFMSRDIQRLEFILADLKGHLESILDQGRFIHVGPFILNWKGDKMAQSAPQLRLSLFAVKESMQSLDAGLESFMSKMTEGRRYLSQLS